MKHLRWLIALTLCLILVSAAAMAEPAFSGGSGTSADPYLISTKDDLVMLAKFVNEQGGGEGRYYKQTADIDLAGVDWVPIGFTETDSKENIYYAFASHYDGAGHLITNANSKGIKSENDDWILSGIFGLVVEGEIKNLHIKDCHFETTVANDALYAYAGGIAAKVVYGKFENCSVSNCAISATCSLRPNNTFAGGVTGHSSWLYNTAYEKCASVKNTLSSQAFCGGFVGISGGYFPDSLEGCYVAECSATVDLKSDDYPNAAGGFIGYVPASFSSNFKKSFVYGTNVEIKGASSNSKISVFASTDSGNITTADCYYGECNVSDGAITAQEKSKQDFSDGTVNRLLGDLFTQSEGSPFPSSGSTPSADYAAVDQAIDKARRLDRSLYKDLTRLDAALNAVKRGWPITLQSEVDAMAAAIMSAIDNLERLPDPTVKPTAKPTPAPTAEPTAEPNLPKTGDGSLLPLWALLLASCAGVLLLKARRRCN